MAAEGANARIGGATVLIRQTGPEIESWWSQLIDDVWNMHPDETALATDPAPLVAGVRGAGLRGRLEARAFSTAGDPLGKGMSLGARRLLLSEAHSLSPELARSLGHYAVGVTTESTSAGEGAHSLRWLQLRVGSELGASSTWLRSEWRSREPVVEVIVEALDEGLEVASSSCGLDGLSLHRSRCGVAARARELFRRAVAGSTPGGAEG